jgi:hypothetical protein
MSTVRRSVPMTVEAPRQSRRQGSLSPRIRTRWVGSSSSTTYAIHVRQAATGRGAAVRRIGSRSAVSDPNALP